MHAVSNKLHVSFIMFKMYIYTCTCTTMASNSSMSSQSASSHDQVSTYFCGHCNKQLSKTLYFKHKKLFYDTRGKCWQSERLFLSSEHGVFDFDLSDSCSYLEDSYDEPGECVYSAVYRHIVGTPMT